MSPIENQINALEPVWFLDAWAQFPPEGFVPGRVRENRFFNLRFDLLTTLDPAVKKWLFWLAPILPKPKTTFFGQTNSEYFFFPAGLSADEIAQNALKTLRDSDSSLAIFKDLPRQSPLLTSDENARSEELLQALQAQGFELVTGEALAYIPIDFKTVVEFMARFSGNRRRQLQKKLRVRSQVQISEKIPGRDEITSSLIDAIYKLFENVYNQSEIHFDKLSKEFFVALLTGDRPDARLFLYHVDGQLIAFTYNLVHRDNFIYKYIGFDYSRSRDFNMYFVTWFHMLEYTLAHNLKNMIAGWTDIEIKAYLGSTFTYTYHLVYFRSRLMRWLLSRIKSLFESDKSALENVQGAAGE